MDKDELVTLLSTEGLRLLDELPPYGCADGVVRVVSELRAAGHSASLVAAVLTQARLRKRAAVKFGEFAQRMLFTDAGLEQATRLSVAALHANRYRAAGLQRVADLGCGIGGDALAMAALDLDVTAVELDELTAAIAAYNLAPWPNAQVVNADATGVDLTGFDGIWLDPARRTTASGATIHRSRNPNDWSPSLDVAFERAERIPTGIKLGPGVDREIIPSDAEAQWVSVDGDVVELALWFGILARPGVRRAATVIGAHGKAELVSNSDSDDVDVRELGEFMYEPDGAVIRARLIGDLGRQLGAGMVSEGIAWLTSADAVDTPFASRFRVKECIPYDVKALKRLVKAHDIGVLEIKKRGVDVDPAALRKTLAPKGKNHATIILTRVQGRRSALLADRD
ncbi:MAG: class I SAM-dependent methyltransferase [Terrimesophilobacter sp.]